MLEIEEAQIHSPVTIGPHTLKRERERERNRSIVEE
jgi:hypothetical protein